MSPANPDITNLLHTWAGGDRGALDQLLEVLYGDLRRIARHQLRKEPRDLTMQTTALVNEVYLRLTRQDRVTLTDRAHFFHLVSHMIRRILVDEARRRTAVKRPSRNDRVVFDEEFMAPQEKQEEWIAVNEALDKFEQIDPRRTQIVEMRYFGGFTLEEIAGIMEVSEATIRRDWNVARAWLLNSLTGSLYESANLEQGF